MTVQELRDELAGFHGSLEVEVIVSNGNTGALKSVLFDTSEIRKTGPILARVVLIVQSQQEKP